MEPIAGRSCLQHAGPGAYDQHSQQRPGDRWVDPQFEEPGRQPMTEEEAEWEWQRQLAEQEYSQEEDDRRGTLSVHMIEHQILGRVYWFCVPRSHSMWCFYSTVLLTDARMPLTSCAAALFIRSVHEQLQGALRYADRCSLMVCQGAYGGRKRVKLCALIDLGVQQA